MNHDDEIFQVDLLDEQRQLSLEELSRVCDIRSTLITELVEEGILEPIEIHTSQWVFSGACIRRVRMAARLQRDLHVNTPGIALALDLMEELEDLRRRLRRL